MRCCSSRSVWGFVEAVGYRRGRFLRAFWELPLDAKLDHIGRNAAAWWLMYVPWLATVAVTAGGLAGLAFPHLALPGLLVLGVALVLT